MLTTPMFFDLCFPLNKSITTNVHIYNQYLYLPGIWISLHNRFDISSITITPFNGGSTFELSNYENIDGENTHPSLFTAESALCSMADLDLAFLIFDMISTSLYYCLLRSTFPTPLFHTQMHLVFEMLYLTQFLMDSLKS